MQGCTPNLLSVEERQVVGVDALHIFLYKVVDCSKCFDHLQVLPEQLTKVVSQAEGASSQAAGYG